MPRSKARLSASGPGDSTSVAMPRREDAGQRGSGPQSGRVAAQRVCGQAAAVHPMDPGRRKPLNATYNAVSGPERRRPLPQEPACGKFW
jgi:hypothetical protein